MDRTVTTIFLIRHAESSPSEDLPEAEWPLSGQGREQAETLAGRLIDHRITGVISSPYIRAVETVRPLADRIGCSVELRSELRERKLCDGLRDDWQELVEKAWSDFSFALPGCESGFSCQQRVRACLDDLVGRRAGETLAVSSHGNAIGLFLNSIEPDFGFDCWKRIRTPEVFRIDWRDGQPEWRADGGWAIH